MKVFLKPQSIFFFWHSCLCVCLRRLCLFCLFFSLLLLYDQYYYYTLLCGNIYINTNTNISVITPVLQIISTCILALVKRLHTHVSCCLCLLFPVLFIYRKPNKMPYRLKKLKWRKKTSENFQQQLIRKLFESKDKNKHGIENATVSPYNSLRWSMSSFTNKLMDFFNWLMWESLNKEWPLYRGEYFSLR